MGNENVYKKMFAPLRVCPSVWGWGWGWRVEMKIKDAV